MTLILFCEKSDMRRNIFVSWNLYAIILKCFQIYWHDSSGLKWFEMILLLLCADKTEAQNQIALIICETEAMQCQTDPVKTLRFICWSINIVLVTYRAEIFWQMCRSSFSPSAIIALWTLGWSYIKHVSFLDCMGDSFILMRERERNSCAGLTMH